MYHNSATASSYGISYYSDIYPISKYYMNLWIVNKMFNKTYFSLYYRAIMSLRFNSINNIVELYKSFDDKFRIPIMFKHKLFRKIRFGKRLISRIKE